MQSSFFKTLTISTLLVLSIVQIAEAKRFSKPDIDKMCSQKKSIPKRGVQFNGERAINKILNLSAGKYTYPNGMLLLYKNASYLLKVPKGKNAIKGTDANDLMGAGGVLGGCSREQLSEAIQRNGLSSSKFKLIKKYK